MFQNNPTKFNGCIMFGFPVAIIDRMKCVETRVNSVSLSLSAVMLEYSVLLFSVIHCYKHCINITNSVEESFSSEGNNPGNCSPDA